MPCAPLLRFSDCPTDTRVEAGEIMSGILEVQGTSGLTSPGLSPSRITSRTIPRSNANNNKPQRVFVRVYRTSSEHFAVLYPARAIVTACRPLASLNLKSCTVESLQNTRKRSTASTCDNIKDSRNLKDIRSLKDLQSLENMKTLENPDTTGSSNQTSQNTEFRVSPRSCEGTTLVFRFIEGTSFDQVDQWLLAFTEKQQDCSNQQRRKRVSEQRIPMPVLIESEESESTD